MLSLISTFINSRSNYPTPPLNTEPYVPEPQPQIDNDSYVAANYFLKYATDPATPNEISKFLLENIIRKNPIFEEITDKAYQIYLEKTLGLMSEMLSLVNEGNQDHIKKYPSLILKMLNLVNEANQGYIKKHPSLMLEMLNLVNKTSQACNNVLTEQEKSLGSPNSLEALKSKGQDLKSSRDKKLEEIREFLQSCNIQSSSSTNISRTSTNNGEDILDSRY